MKNNALKRKSYKKLLHKLFIQTMIVLFAAAFIIMQLRLLLWGKFADPIIYFIQKILKMDKDAASYFYQFYIRNHLDLLINIIIVITFFILLRLSISWFTRYFDEMSAGIDKLADESDEMFQMSPELEFMEAKLEEVRGKLKKRDTDLKAAEQRKNDVVVYLAHDIRTPLTSVIGYLSLLDEAPEMPEEQKMKYVHIALAKAHRLEVLMNEFFEITRYNYQDVPLYKEMIPLRYMIAQITDELYPQLSSHGNKVEADIPENLLIFADAGKLARVFNNILKNAISYGDENNLIRIQAEDKNNTVIIRFENHGVIPEDKLPLIFEKFYRLDLARSTATGGAGLGLAIAKDIITLHGGKIHAESRDSITVFTIELPIQPKS